MTTIAHVLVLAAVALAQGATYPETTESAQREAREILASELFGHYDVTTLDVLKVEPQEHRGLVAVTLAFSAKRNATRSPSLNAAMFEPGSPMCQDWLYLHCGVPVGHVFEGQMQLLMAVDRTGTWRVVSPHWRSRRQYALDGYLMMEGRQKEGYVVFPGQPAR